MRHILLVEDDASLGESLSQRLSKEYAVSWKKTFSEAVSFVKESKKIDLYILDVGLPDGNGFELALAIKKNKNAPILFLTAQADAESRLKGYEIGADEFIPKPFLLKELLLRIEHVLSSYKELEVLTLSECEIRFSENLILKKDTSTDVISASDMKVLEILIKASPKVLSRDDIMNEVWGLDKNLSFRTIDNIMVRLRQHLGVDGAYIKSVRGVGYQWLK